MSKGQNEKINEKQNEEVKFYKMSRKALPKIFVSFLAMFVVAGGITLLVNFIAESMQESEIVVEIPEPLIPWEKIIYGRRLNFRFQVVINGEKNVGTDFHASRFANPYDPDFNPFYTELIFVHSEADAVGFADNVIVAWPRGDGFTEGLINGFHWVVDREEHFVTYSGVPGILSREVVTLEQFGLTYPLTIADLVDNWERVNELWMALDGGDHAAIRGFGQRAIATSTN